MSQGRQVFISYARKDGRDHAERLYAELVNRGIPAWRDTRNLDPHQDFTAEIERAIEESSHVTVCITPDTKRDNSFVRREIGYALALKKPIIPLMFAEIAPHVHIVNHTRIYFTGQVWDEPFSELVNRINAPVTASDYPDIATDPFREYLSKLYQEITHYLNVTVFSLIELRSEASPDAVATDGGVTETSLLLKSFFQTALTREQAQAPASQAEIHDFENFAAAFEHYEGRLLLLGEPGAGKTTVLMAYARDAVAKRLENPNTPLPVLARISDYPADSTPTLSDWLVAQLGDAFGERLQSAITIGNTLLLLDGLDELGSERPVNPEKPEGERYDPRLRFMQVIPANNKVMVTCRVKDYEAMGEKIALKGAVTLKALDDAQMHAYLATQPELMAAIEADDVLREMLSTPLLLSFFAFAYQGMTEAQRQQLRDLSKGPNGESAANLRDAIFRKYVKERYKHEKRKSNAKLPYTLYRMKKVLGKTAMDDTMAIVDEENRFIVKELEGINVESFIEQVCAMHIVFKAEDSSLRFMHLRLRDHFAFGAAVTSLANGDRDMRQAAAKLLGVMGYLGDRRAVEPLITALDDRDRMVKYYAVQGLELIGDPRAIEPLKTHLGDAHPGTRADVLRALERMNAAVTVEQLIDAVRNTDCNVMYSNVIWSMSPTLDDDPSAEDWGIKPEFNIQLYYYLRSVVYTMLEEINDVKAVEVLINLLNDDDASVRYKAVVTLGKIGDVRAVVPLIKVLGDSKIRISVETVISLGKISYTRAVEALTNILNHDDASMRFEAVIALGKIGDNRAVRYLIGLLNDDNPNMRFVTVAALGKIGDAQAVQPLVDLLHDEDEAIRLIVAQALERIGTPQALATIEQWRRTQEQ